MSASHARIQYFGFAEYPDRWREIWEIFSREAVWSGAFDQYAASKRKRGNSEVDSEFLKDIEGWRDVLARNLALRNVTLTADDLNASVQQIIDRLIFLRMAEDRGLESYGQLLKLCDRPGIYARFVGDVCRRADDKYNSGLFHFQKEPGVADAPDTLTPRLAVDDNALKPILQSLYFEHGCPYHFGVLPVEILGTVYERFLGKVIRWHHDKWYALGRSQNLAEMEQEKILTPSIAKNASFTHNLNNFYYFIGSGGGGGGEYGIKLKPTTKESYRYVLALLNSRLLDTILKTVSSTFANGYYAYNRQYIEQLPIRSIDFTNPADRTRHDKLVALVEKMLVLTPKLRGATSESEKAALQNAVTTTDAEIDRLVYELYGLTEAEIEIVEGQD